ncbi:hypothetical protein SAMN06265222_12157 [Neorhodopirellula lusitana]|uniref:Uncharacterized protein n=1 Tax=Neorhodopirellula lusitana TaxID=445327 RepID=A0ABY1QSK2_9BACT|nr:hypothetical protein SAMN06265222_12157 [Neorhodopirellula lusitana]
MADFSSLLSGRIRGSNNVLTLVKTRRRNTELLGYGNVVLSAG